MSKAEERRYAREWTFLETEPVARGDATAVVARRHAQMPFPPLIMLPHNLKRSAFETQSIALFWDVYFPANKRIESTSRNGGIICRNWTLVIHRLDLNDSTLRPALLTFCLARLGEIHNDRSVTEQAINIYGTALKEMSHALHDSRKVQSDEVLVAGKLMSLYEMFYGPTTPKLKTRGANWRSHIEGVIKLIEIRGPRQRNNKDTHTLFVDTRVSAILAAIVARKPNFFAAPQWCKLPFETEPKDPADYLHDIMAILPMLLQEYDLLEYCSDRARTHQRLVKLFDRCKATDQALQRWHARLSSAFPNPLPSAIRKTTEEANMPNQRRFSSFDLSDYGLATTLPFYWATCNLVHTLTHMVLATLRSSGAAGYGEDLSEHMNPHRSAISIAHSVDYFTAPEMGILGPQLFAFPMAVAFLYFRTFNGPNAEEERQGLRASMERLSRSGLSLETFLASLQAATNKKTTPNSLEDAWAKGAQAWYGDNENLGTMQIESGKPHAGH
ncbi:MAG: hypothetical protein Q9201_000753 [Fulgogasparrea decipioides]